MAVTPPVLFVAALVILIGIIVYLVLERKRLMEAQVAVVDNEGSEVS